jgi:hypothetical protein
MGEPDSAVARPILPEANLFRLVDPATVTLTRPGIDCPS